MENDIGRPYRRATQEGILEFERVKAGIPRLRFPLDPPAPMQPIGGRQNCVKGNIDRDRVPVDGTTPLWIARYQGHNQHAIMRTFFPREHCYPGFDYCEKREKNAECRRALRYRFIFQYSDVLIKNCTKIAHLYLSNNIKAKNERSINQSINQSNLHLMVKWISFQWKKSVWIQMKIRYKGREVRWKSVRRERMASSVCHRILSGRYNYTYGLPLFRAKRCFTSAPFLCFLNH